MNDDGIHEKVNRWMRLDDSQFSFARSAISDRLREGETAEDVMVGGAYLASRRAQAFVNRRPGPADLEFALSIFTWWPFKPDPPEFVEDRLLGIRLRVVEEVRRGDVEYLDRIVPRRTLRLSLWELYSRQQQGIAEFLDEQAL